MVVEGGGGDVGEVAAVGEVELGGVNHHRPFLCTAARRSSWVGSLETTTAFPSLSLGTLIFK